MAAYEPSCSSVMRGFGAGPEGGGRAGGREDRTRDAVRLEVVGDLDEVLHRRGLLRVALLVVHLHASSGPRSPRGRPSAGPAAPGTARATVSASSGESTPARCMPVSTSTRIPSVVPAATAAAERASASPTSSTLTVHVRLARQERGGAALHRVHQLVGDEHVVRAGADHDDRLPDGRGAEAEGAVLELHPGDVRALVVLDVAAQAGVQLGQPRLHVRRGSPAGCRGR